MVRAITSRDELLRDPRLTRALLEPPIDGILPAGVLARADRSSIRVASLNIHMSTPSGHSLDPANESLLALRDDARWVNAVDPDVLFVQELRNRPVAAALTPDAGLGDSAGTFAHLIGADEMAFTPAIAQDPFRTAHQHYGTAIYVRNGFHIDRAVNARLPTSTPDVELRSVGIADVRAPDARGRITALGTHLANRPLEDQALRDAQLGAIIDMSRGIRRDGGFGYVGALDGAQGAARGFERERLVLAGDLNQLQGETDRILRPGGFVHANDELAASGPNGGTRARAAQRDTSSLGTPQSHRIDHPYVRGLQVVDSAVADVAAVEFRRGLPTDHRGLVVDVR
ncbi:MAG: hypothetical protein JWM86_2592 [Thermoleophilia bacterium]|nr:hypothetical protein [Thermoleophilia bacterium]